GKTGINTGHGKNLVGVFQQPRLVVADTQTLNTLPPREFHAGYAEVVKYGLINDAGFFAWLEENRNAVFAGGAARSHAIAVSCRAKAAIVAADEFEEGSRALLNLGHTFGHALEAAAGYGAGPVHGEAVAIGMAMAYRFSARHGLCAPEDANRVVTHLKAAGLPTTIGAVGDAPPVDELMRLIAQDKKVKGGQLTFVLARGVGEAYIADDVAADDIAAFLEDERRR
ncbi:MAG: 3-dehydroquinate synthase, partial [Hyphomicrobiales bacterium]|nr:3-dehydroquinate synthase [Hyphomicrobiales bacterium]